MPDFNTAKVAFKNAVNLFSDNNLNEAIEQLNEILNTHPEHLNALDLLGIIFIKLNKPDEALEVINKSISLNKDNNGDNDLMYNSIVKLLAKIPILVAWVHRRRKGLPLNLSLIHI